MLVRDHLDEPKEVLVAVELETAALHWFGCSANWSARLVCVVVQQVWKDG